MAITEKGKNVAVKSPPSANSTTGKRRKPSPEVEDGGGARRKKRQSGVLRFLDTDAVEAGTDSDEEEERQPDGKDLETDFVNHGKAETKYPKGSGKSYPLPFFMKQDDLSDDELEELIKERYGRDSKHVVYDEELKECEVDVTKGPPIWRVKCMIGRERHIAFCLMQKFVDLHKFGTKLEIFSVFLVEHVKGFVYFEADKACDVTEACKGIYDVYSSQVGLVPRNEVPHLLSVRNKVCEASKDAWVRIKSGKYKGDLGRIVAVDEARKRATIKLVPRLDLRAIAQKFGGGISLKRAAVPPPRLITSRELEDFRTLVQTRRDRQTGEIFEVLDGMMLKDGYLYKKVSVASLVYWGVEPSDAELLKFMDMCKGDPDDFSWISSVYNGDEKLGCSEASAEEMPAKQGSGFNLYDLVLFGQKAFGVIVAIENDCFRILKGDMEVPEVATVKLQEIKNGCADKMFTACDRHMKSISISDTVKVLDGPHEGRKGIVRHMYKGALFIHDVSQEENGGYFCVQSKLCKSVKESTEPTGGRPSSTLPQSSTKSSDQTDTSRSFNQHHQGNRGQAFTIGETLRIRKGPLKGFLCRVMGVYRSDVTVKLDSLAKVITVPSDLLCPTKPMGDSWQTPSVVARDIDKEADEKQATDHWRSKSAPEARDEQPVSDNAWGNIATESKGESGWGKVSGGIQSDKWGKRNDNWGTLKVPGGSQTDKWGKVTDNDVVSTGGWTKTGSSGQNQTDVWNKPKSFDGNQLSSWSKANSGGVGVYKPKEVGGKPKDIEDRPTLVRGRGRGGNSEDKGIINQGAWTNLMSCNAAREKGWESEKHDAGEHGYKEISWNQQRDFDGGRGSRQERGIGRGQCGARARGGDGGGRGSRVQYGARESRDEDGGGRASDWSNSGEGWGFGSGRGWGQNGDSDDTRSSGRGRGRGHFCDEEQEADPWRSKPASGARDQEPGSGDAWASKAVSGARDEVRGDIDAWGSKTPMAKGGSSFNTMKGQGEGPNNIWDNAKNATDAGWSKAGPFGQRQGYGTNQFSSCNNKDTNNTGGRGLGQWMGRVGNFEDQGNNNRGWNKPIGRHGGRGQGGEEQGWRSETDIRDKDSYFNPQRDFNGNQRSNRGGGRRGARGSGDGNGGGRHGARGSGDGNGGERFGARGSRGRDSGGRFGARGSRGRDGGGRGGGSGGRYGARGSKDENGGGRGSENGGGGRGSSWGNSGGGRGYGNGRGRGRNEDSGRERGRCRGRDHGRGQGRGPYDRPSRGGRQSYT